MKRAIVFAVLACAAAGCADVPVVVRASSVELVGVPGSSLRVSRSPAAVLDSLKGLFDKRGYHLMGAYPAKDGSGDVLYLFDGHRDTVVFGAVEPSILGGSEGEVASYQLGSRFHVSLHALGNATEVFILGKATLNGTPICADADALLKRFDYWCVDTTVTHGDALRPSLRGQAEADVVRGVLLELAGGGVLPMPTAATR